MRLGKALAARLPRTHKHFHYFSKRCSGGCCQTNANRSPKSTTDLNSGHELAPFGQGGGSVLLECFSAVQVTLVAEVVLDG